MKKSYIHLLSLLATLALSSSAFAVSIVQTQSFGFVPNGNQTLAYNQFDDSLGTLTKVTVSLAISKSGGRFELDNDSGSQAIFNAEHKVQGWLTSTDVKFLDASSNTFVAFENDIAATSVTGVTLEATTGDATDQFDRTNAIDYADITPATISASASGDVGAARWTGTVVQAGATGYVGNGTFTLKANANQDFNTSGFSGVSTATSPAAASGNVTITYEYTPVPEPGIMALLICSAGALLLGRSRRI